MHELQSYLEREKLSQVQFAAMLRVSQASVSDWINGENHPTIPRLKKIAKITGISLEKLLADKPA